jgi:enoyl-CoA hydratase/carnithine racemase
MAEVDFEERDGIAYITLNRPDKLNATTDTMIRELKSALYALDDSPSALVGILNGAGRAFCTGADLKAKLSRPAEEIARLEIPAARDARTSDLMYTFTNWKPVIAAVHGYALGAGLHLSLMCDMVVAAQETKFQITEVQLGRDATQFWGLIAQRASAAVATDLALTARYWDAAEALGWGLVDRLVPAGEHLSGAEELAKQIMANPPLAVRAVVEARRGVLSEVELRAKLRRPRGLHSSEDGAEALRAKLEKRQPVFHAR